MYLGGWLCSKTSLSLIELLSGFSLPLFVYVAIIDILQSLSKTKPDTYGVTIAQVAGDHLLGYRVEAYCSKGAYSYAGLASNALVIVGDYPSQLFIPGANIHGTSSDAGS